LKSWDKSIDKLDEKIGKIEDAIKNINTATASQDGGTEREREKTESEKIRKFANYRLARAKKTLGDGVTKTYEDVWDRVTLEELDYYLQRALEVPEEERYQHRRRCPSGHESGWSARGLSAYDGKGCNQSTGCVPECRYYPETGRIEDEEIINEYKQEMEERRKAGTLIEGKEKEELDRKIQFNLYVTF
jgi:hypothetical protein